MQTSSASSTRTIPFRGSPDPNCPTFWLPTDAPGRDLGNTVVRSLNNSVVIDFATHLSDAVMSHLAQDERIWDVMANLNDDPESIGKALRLCLDRCIV